METRLDLSSVDGHAAAVEWIRNHVVLRKEATSGVIKLMVGVDTNGRDVTLFMNPGNHYIMGFQGRDKIYLLRDDGRSEIKRALISNKIATEKEIDDELGLGSDHKSLGTLGHDFTKADLQEAVRLSDYSRGGASYDAIRRPLSLLVCMIAESARLRTMEVIFRGIYTQLGRPIKADEAIQSWKEAAEIAALAQKYFGAYPRPLRVEKLAKRSAELRALWDHIVEALGPFGNERAIKQQIIDGTYPRDRVSSAAHHVQRFADIATELTINNRKPTADEISTIMTACKNEAAIYAAKEGVFAPS